MANRGSRSEADFRKRPCGKQQRKDERSEVKSRIRLRKRRLHRRCDLFFLCPAGLEEGFEGSGKGLKRAWKGSGKGLERDSRGPGRGLDGDWTAAGEGPRRPEKSLERARQRGREGLEGRLVNGQKKSRRGAGSLYSDKRRMPGGIPAARNSATHISRPHDAPANTWSAPNQDQPAWKTTEQIRHRSSASGQKFCYSEAVPTRQNSHNARIWAGSFAFFSECATFAITQ